jgi:hypothetical protein
MPKRGHCDFDLYFHGRIKVIISAMGKILFVLSPSAFIFSMYMYYNTTECFIQNEVHVSLILNIKVN